jgi:hypothetical protein
MSVDRLAILRSNPHPTKAFCGEGAIGSHLENLERKGGFKGFNQKSVSVIEATDPQKQNAVLRSA